MSHVADRPRSDQDAPWWHPRHPTGPTLYGFFAGLGFAIAVPGLFAALLGALADGGAGSSYPLLALALLVPLALLPAQRTRRFGLAMLLGMLSTVLVVAVVAALVLWLLVSIGG